MRYFLLHCLILLWLTSQANGQQTPIPETITIEIIEKPFEEALNQLHKKYNINFYYSSDRIALKKPVTVIFDHTPVIEALNELCTKARVQYQINGNQVILYRKSKSETSGNISGYVQDSLTGERLIGATIVIDGTNFGTTTNAYGFYSYTLSVAKVTIRCSYIGYQSATKEIEVSSSNTLSFALAPAVKEIEAVKVESGQLNRSVNLKAGTDMVPTSIMRSYPAMLSENDVLQFIKMMPGVQTTTEGLNGLFVRGGMPQHTSFIIDDAPMYNMFHFSGWFSTINPDAVKEVRLYKSHLPGKSSGSLASVIDVRLRDGNNQHFNASGSIGTITSRITLEDPIVKNKASFIVSARRTYLDQLIRVFRLQNTVDIGTIYFYDLNAKVNYTLNGNNRFYFSSYAGKDIVDDGGVNWGNSFLSARWNHLFSERIFSNLCISGSWYRHCFDAQVSEDEISQLSIRIGNYNAKYDVSWYTQGNHKINFGLNLRYNFLPPVKTSGSVLNVGPNTDKSVYRQDLYGSYVQANFGLFRGLSADIGMKLTIAHRKYPEDEKSYILPEPGLGFEYAFNQEVSLKTAYSRNVQYHHGIGVFELLLPFDKYILAGSKLKPQFADHLSSGIFYSPARNQIEVSLESFYSFYRNQYRIPVTNDVFFDRDVDYSPEGGKIRAYGLEVSFRKLSGRFTGILSYTLSKALRKEEVEVNQGSYYYAYYDRRHDLVVSLSYKASRRITLSSNWVYMSGNPYSLPVGKYELRGRSVPLYDQQHLYNQRMPDYHRMDISARFGFGKTLPLRHHLTLMLYNVYAHKNPVFYSYGDVADGNPENNPNSGYNNRSFNMIGYYFFNFFPSFSYEFKFGK